MKNYDSELQKNIFSKNLRHYISINNMQQKDFADSIGEKRSTVNNWCMGNTLPSVTKIQKIADYFGIVKTDLVDDHELTTEAVSKELEVTRLVHQYGINNTCELLSAILKLNDEERNTFITPIKYFAKAKSSNDSS